MIAKKPELLAPAGSLEKLRFAVLYGADAVYLGGRKFSLRAQADNFTVSQMRKGIDFARKYGVKVYVLANIFARDRDFVGITSYLSQLESIGVDGVVVADYGVFKQVRDEFPKLKVHISTQANVTNLKAARFWSRLGAKRVTLARELSLQELKKIGGNADIETEMFVHGAMCISYSGRCLLSKYLVGRDANRGDCAHSCRWKYYLIEADPPASRLSSTKSGEAGRPEDWHPISEDERGFYVLNSKDLCLIEHLPELIGTGINSFKVEGRMKSIHYVATVVSVYRQAIDEYCSNPKNYKFNPEWKKELEKVSHRGYTAGFVVPGTEATENVDSAGYRRLYDFLGVVEGYNERRQSMKVGVRNQIKRGDEVEILKVDGGVEKAKIGSMHKDKEEIAIAHPNFVVDIAGVREVPRFSILRRKSA